MVYITVTLFLILFITFIRCYLVNRRCVLDRNDEECQDPIILKNKIQKELEQDDEKFFNYLIRAQNINIISAIKNNKNECFYSFHKSYKDSYGDKYKDKFTEKAKEYYKKYKIDGDKISWD